MENKIRILIYGLSDSLGGIETFLLKMISYFDRNKFQFDFLQLGSVQPFFYNELKSFGCNFYYVTSRRESPIKNKKEIDELFSKEHFDILHCNLNSLSYITPAILAYVHGIKVIIHSHNGSMSGEGITSKFLHRLNFFRLPKKSVQYVAVSDIAGKWMFGNNAKYIVINNGVDTNLFQYSEIARKKIRTEFKIDKNEVLLHVGKFRKQKNHTFLIEIFYSYLKLNSNAILLLIGDGDLQEEIRLQVSRLGISNNVIFVGQKPNIYDFLSAADKFLFPSLYEGFPISLIEAEATGLPCFVSDIITKEVQLAGVCKSISLSYTPNEWANIIYHHSAIINRENFWQKVENMGLGINSEVDTVALLYKHILGI